MSDFEHLEKLAVKWASDRNIIKGSSSVKQHGKLTEETLEMANALAKLQLLVELYEDNIISYDTYVEHKLYLLLQLQDDIGDTLVVLSIIAAQNDLKLTNCLAIAYNEIKDRKGMMINGVFVKESPNETSHS